MYFLDSVIPTVLFHYIAFICHQVARNRSPNHCTDVSKCVTIIIKTKGKLQQLKEIIKAARQRYPNISVVVIDELPMETEQKEKDIETVTLPPSGVVYVKTKKGVPFGRKMALTLVETKYALTLDHDFVFTHDTNITKMVDMLERSNIHIVGGSVVPGGMFEGIFRVADKCVADKCYPNLFTYKWAYYERVPFFDHCVVADRVKNFFLADRQVVLAAGSWDTSRPFYEHEDFFIQMRRSSVRTAYCSDVKIHHNKINRDLADIRMPYAKKMERHLLLKWGFPAKHYCKAPMYSVQSCCETCERYGMALDPKDGNPAKAFS